MVISKLDYTLCHISFILEKQTGSEEKCQGWRRYWSRDWLRFHCRMFNDSGRGERANIQTRRGAGSLGGKGQPPGQASVRAGGSQGGEAGSTLRALSYPPLLGDLVPPGGAGPECWLLSEAPWPVNTHGSSRWRCQCIVPRKAWWSPVGVPTLL